MTAFIRNTPKTTTKALVVRSAVYGEADLVVDLFTLSLGKVSCIARRARQQGKRQRFVLEPMHTLVVELAGNRTGALLPLLSSTIERPRLELLSQWPSLQSAGEAIRWVRSLVSVASPEPEVWHLLEDLLDQLNLSLAPESVSPALSLFGLRLLECLGYGLSFTHCAICARSCAPDRSAYIDASRGGIVCRSCGGSGAVLDSRSRVALAMSAASGIPLPAEVASVASTLVNQVIHSIVKP